jgi:hypothetical protein
MKSKLINVQGREITINEVGGEAYICLTDIVKGEEGSDHIKNWMRNRNTVEFLGLWESLNNPNFKGVEFDTFRREAGLNSFSLTPRKWIERTGATGLISRAGNKGGTYAHKDIALEFCTWLSPLFKLLVLKEFQRLKENEALEGKWDMRRYISKANYKIQTDAISDKLLPIRELPKNKEGMVYAEEAELLNDAMFGVSAKEWRTLNPRAHQEGLNIRDFANTHQLIVLANLESINAELTRDGIPQQERLRKLRDVAITQLESIKNSSDPSHLMIQSPQANKPTDLE